MLHMFSCAIEQWYKTVHFFPSDIACYIHSIYSALSFLADTYKWYVGKMVHIWQVLCSRFASLNYNSRIIVPDNSFHIVLTDSLSLHLYRAPFWNISYAIMMHCVCVLWKTFYPWNIVFHTWYPCLATCWEYYTTVWCVEGKGMIENAEVRLSWNAGVGVC